MNASSDTLRSQSVVEHLDRISIDVILGVLQVLRVQSRERMEVGWQNMTSHLNSGPMTSKDSDI